MVTLLPLNCGTHQWCVHCSTFILVISSTEGVRANTRKLLEFAQLNSFALLCCSFVYLQSAEASVEAAEHLLVFGVRQIVIIILHFGYFQLNQAGGGGYSSLLWIKVHQRLVISRDNRVIKWGARWRQIHVVCGFHLNERVLSGAAPNRALTLQTCAF